MTFLGRIFEGVRGAGRRMLGSSGQVYADEEARRRRRLAASAEEGASKVLSPATRFERRLLDSLASHGSTIAGRVHILNLDRVRRQYGEEWEEKRERIYAHIDMVIDKMLGDMAQSFLQDDGNYLLVFAPVAKEDAQEKVQELGRAILDKVFGTDSYGAGLEVATAVCAVDGQLGFKKSRIIGAVLDDLESNETKIERCVPQAEQPCSRDAAKNPRNDRTGHAGDGSGITSQRLDDLQALLKQAQKELGDLGEDIDMEADQKIAEHIKWLPILKDAKSELDRAEFVVVEAGRSRTFARWTSALEPDEPKTSQDPEPTPDPKPPKDDSVIDIAEFRLNFLKKAMARLLEEAEKDLSQLRRDSDVQAPRSGQARSGGSSASTVSTGSSLRPTFWPIWSTVQQDFARLLCDLDIAMGDGSKKGEQLADQIDDPAISAQVDILVLKWVVQSLRKDMADETPGRSILIPVHISTLLSPLSRGEFVRLCNKIAPGARSGICWDLHNSYKEEDHRLVSAIETLRAFGAGVMISAPVDQIDPNKFRTAGAFGVRIDLSVDQVPRQYLEPRLRFIAGTAKNKAVEILATGLDCKDTAHTALLSGLTYLCGTAVADPIEDLHTARFSQDLACRF